MGVGYEAPDRICSLSHLWGTLRVVEIMTTCGLLCCIKSICATAWVQTSHLLVVEFVPQSAGSGGCEFAFPLSKPGGVDSFLWEPEYLGPCEPSSGSA